MRLAAAVLLAGGLACCAQTNTLSAKYAGTADHLVSAALADTNGYANLTYLTDRIGNRLSGSASLNRAIAWSVERMKAAGLSNVRKIPTKVPHWVRGQESAQLLQPVAKPLHMIGIGMSVGAPPEGITADAVVVSNFDELEKLGRSVRGKIVVFNAPFESYGKTVAYRAFGPSRAAAFGAVAALVRSTTPLAMQQPHTGALLDEENQPKIPAAALSIEDTLLLDRLQKAGALSAFIWQCRRILRRMRTARTSLASYPAATGRTRLLSWAGTSIPGMSGRVRRMMAPASWPAWKLLR